MTDASRPEVCSHGAGLRRKEETATEIVFSPRAAHVAPPTRKS